MIISTFIKEKIYIFRNRVSRQSPFSWAYLEVLNLYHGRLLIIACLYFLKGIMVMKGRRGVNGLIAIASRFQPDALAWTKAEIPVRAFFMPSTDAAWMNLDLTLTSSGNQDISTSLSLFLSFCSYLIDIIIRKFILNRILWILWYSYCRRFALKFNVNNSVTALSTSRFDNFLICQIFIIGGGATTWRNRTTYRLKIK